MTLTSLLLIASALIITLLVRQNVKYYKQINELKSENTYMAGQLKSTFKSQIID